MDSTKRLPAEISAAEVYAPWRSAALLRVHGRGHVPHDATLRYVADDGTSGAAWRLPDGPHATDDGWVLAFAVPPVAVRNRSCTLSLDDGNGGAAVPWALPDPLIRRWRPDAVSHDVRTGAEGGSPRLLSGWHVLVAMAAWLLYVAEMSLQSTRHLPPAWADLLITVLLCAVTISCLTLGWVAWNVWLHRRRGERRAKAPLLAAALERDSLGRVIVSSVASPAHARRIHVWLPPGDGTVKRFAHRRAPRA